MAVPYTFGTATASIPLSQLDSNFSTAITLGNTSIQLGNTVSTLNNMTLANVTISSGNITLTNVSATTANVTTANVVTLVVTGNETVQGSSTVTGNVSALNLSGAGASISSLNASNLSAGTVATARLASGSASSSTYLRGDQTWATVTATPGGSTTQVQYNNAGVLSGSAGLTFDGTNFATTGTATAAKLIPTGNSATGNGMYLPATNSVGFSTNGTNAVYINASQNVGIGTSSITSYSGFTTLAINNATNGGLIDFYTAGAPQGQIFSSATEMRITKTGANYITAYTNGLERMRIDSSGNLLVGLTAQGLSGLFEVNGAVAGYSTLRFPYIGSSTGTAVIIDASGYLRASSSSRRYKENIEPIDVGLGLVMQMQPVKYNLKEGGIAQVGFIAEDFPETRLVNHSMVDPTNPEKGEQIESVNYNNLTAILTKAIQEQQALITQLTDRIAALESKG